MLFRSPDVLSLSVTTANNTFRPVTGSLNLTVRSADNSPRILTNLVNKTYLADATVATETAINFTIGDADTAATAFVNNATTGARIVATSDNPNLILPADIAAAIGGTGNARTITIKHQPYVTGTATITITINDGALQRTYLFNVTVIPALNYYWDILAGSGTPTSTDGISTSATFNYPEALTMDAAGKLYTGDIYGYKIRKIDPVTRQVTTIAGSGADGFNNAQVDNANPLLASFGYIRGLAVDSSGNIYVAENYSYPNNKYRIRKVAYNSGTNTYGPVTTLYDNGPTIGYSVGLRLTADQSGLYIGFQNGIAKLNLSNNQVTILAGGTGTGSADGIGTAATFNTPQNMGADLNGNLLLSDNTGTTTRQITPAGVVTTLFSDIPAALGEAGLIQLRSGYYLRGDGAHSLQQLANGDATTFVGTGAAATTIGLDRKSTRLNSSHTDISRMPSFA